MCRWEGLASPSYLGAIQFPSHTYLLLLQIVFPSYFVWFSLISLSLSFIFNLFLFFSFLNLYKIYEYISFGLGWFSQFTSFFIYNLFFIINLLCISITFITIYLIFWAYTLDFRLPFCEIRKKKPIFLLIFRWGEGGVSPPPSSPMEKNPNTEVFGKDHGVDSQLRSETRGKKPGFG